MSAYEFKSSPIKAGDDGSLEARWWIDTPRNSAYCAFPHGTIEVSGWVFSTKKTSVLIRTPSKTYEIELTEERKDVLKKFLTVSSKKPTHSKYGFTTKIHFEGHLEFGIRQDNCEYWVQEISIITRPKVISGRNNWLFLDNDTNRSVDQFQGNLLLSSEVISNWVKYHDWVSDTASHIKAEWQLLVVPAKEEIFPEYYPFKRGELTPIDQFLQEFKSIKNVSCPINALLDTRELSYYRTDTHWSDYGAYVAAIEILKNFKLDNHIIYLKNTFHTKLSEGDLGSRLTPPHRSVSLFADHAPSSITKIFDSCISNIGRIWIFENLESSSSKKVIIFGDSFSVNLVNQLSCVFRRVVYAHTVASIDQTILDHEQPDFLLLQTNQRFLLKHPETDFSIWNTIQSKTLEFSDDKRKSIVAQINTQPHETCVFYINKMLNILNV